MLLSQKYHTDRKSIGDNNLNSWIIYESLESIPKPDESSTMEYSPAPIKLQKFFFECFKDDSATEVGWKVGFNGRDEKTLYIPVRRFCFLEEGNVPRPTIRYYMGGDWLTAKEAQDRMASYI